MFQKLKISPAPFWGSLLGSNLYLLERGLSKDNAGLASFAGIVVGASLVLLAQSLLRAYRRA